MMNTWHQEIRSLERQSTTLSAPTQLDKFLHAEGVMSPDQHNDCNYDIVLINQSSILDRFRYVKLCGPFELDPKEVESSKD